MNKMTKRNPSIILIFLVPAVYFTHCKKFVEVNPPVTALTDNSVYVSDATAIAVLTGIYTNISSGLTSTAGTVTSLSLFPGLSADELTLWNGSSNPQGNAYYLNDLQAGTQSGYGSEFWITFYSYIYRCNSAIEGLNTSSSLTPAVKQQLLGEAEFMRAFFYFYLVNLYGEVPLALTADYTVNQSLARSDTGKVYQQIVNDLLDAEAKLSPLFLDGTVVNPSPERVRPTKWAAAALLARVYLYQGNWAGAEAQADTVIGQPGLFRLSSLETVFLRASLGNNEAIWQLQPVNPNINTQDAQIFVLPYSGPSSGNNYGAFLSAGLLGSFEPNDERRIDWVDSSEFAGQLYYYPYKYKVDSSGLPVTEFQMILRLGEQFLIRAEARAQQGNAPGAMQDLNTIRARAGLGPSTQPNLLAAIGRERQIELFTEMGQRWLDLKRAGQVNAVMEVATPLKGGSWDSYQQLYPVAQGDIQDDPQLTQNAGYQ
jgi:hypothetical protein